MGKNEVNDKVIVAPKENYAKLLDEACILIRGLHVEILSHYHKLGAKIHELCDRPDKYGQHTVQTFSEDLSKKGIKLGADSLYNAHQIYRYISAKQLKAATAAALPLNKVLLLCKKSVDDDTRQAVIDEAYSTRNNGERFDVETALDDRIKTAKAKGTVPADSEKEVKRAAKVVKNAEKLITDLDNKLKEIGELVTLICREDNVDRMKDAFNDFGDANTAMTAMIDHWREQVTVANKAFKTVQEVLES